MNRVYFIAALVFLVLSCKKDKKANIELSGSISDGVNGGGVSGVTVTLSYRQYQNGVASSAFTTIGTYVTSSDGNYSFSFEKPSAILYRIQLNRSDYFESSEEINPDLLTTQNQNTRNYTLFPSASFKILMTNTSPFNSQDQIVFQNLSEASSCASCCNNSIKIFNGMTVDTSLTCTRYGDKYVRFQWIVTKNTVFNTYTDSVFCPKGQLTSYQINY